MNSRIPKISLVIFALLALSACSTEVGTNAATSTGGGAIELAVTEACVEGTDPKCVSVMGDSIVLPSAFERAGVDGATAAQGQGANTVDVTFTEDGATVLRTMTEEAAQAGGSARLVMKFGEEIQAVVTVMQAIEDGRTQIDLAPEVSAQEGLDLIRAG